VKFYASDARVHGVGWRCGRGVPPLAILVAALVLLTGAGHLAAPVVHATPQDAPVHELIIGYEVGAPLMRVNGQPWGSQCVHQKHHEFLKVGRSIGAGMATIRLIKPISVKRALTISRQLERCPYVAWAEPNSVRFDLPPDSPGDGRSVRE
jgi:hypothetical protein